MLKKVEEHATTEKSTARPVRKIAVRKLDKLETTGLCSPNG